MICLLLFAPAYMKRSSPQKNNDCQQQLSATLQLNAMLMETINNLQQSNQDLIEENRRKDNINAEQASVMAIMQAKEQLSQQTIIALEDSAISPDY